jgi:hypothetical protein
MFQVRSLRREKLVIRGGRWTPAALLAILVLAAVALVACGGDGDDEQGGGDGISEAEVQDAGLEYARCMREKGLDVPDPGGAAPEQGNPFGNLDLDDQRVQKAMDACGERLPELVGDQ